MDPEKESLIEQFINVAGVDRDRAKFFLESSSWDLSVRIWKQNAYFENIISTS